MSRRKKKSNTVPYPDMPLIGGTSLPKYQNSVIRNQSRFNHYVNQLSNLALSRFKWLNLPETVDGQFMERILFYYGMIVFFHGKNNKMNGFFATRFTSKNVKNIYDNFTDARSIGNNGWNYQIEKNKFVVIFDNLNRNSIVNSIYEYAYKLTDVDRTLEVLQKHAKMPYIISGTKEQEEDMVNLWKQIDGNEPAVIVNSSSFSNITFNAVPTMNPAVPQTIASLQDQKQKIMNEVLEFLGISPNNPAKVQQQSLAETEGQNENIEFARLSHLDARRYACEKINKRFNLNIKVVINNDYQSDNFEMDHNERVETEVEKGANPATINQNDGGREND